MHMLVRPRDVLLSVHLAEVPEQHTKIRQQNCWCEFPETLCLKTVGASRPSYVMDRWKGYRIMHFIPVALNHLLVVI